MVQDFRGTISLRRRSLVQLYTYMAKQSRYANAWREALTIGGVDGTLRNRFVGTSAAGNVRGKTGTIDQVSALSGYVTTGVGRKIGFFDYRQRREQFESSAGND